MGWFWADDNGLAQSPYTIVSSDDTPTSIPRQSLPFASSAGPVRDHSRWQGLGQAGSPPQGCPMHEKSAAAMTPKAVDPESSSSCPYPSQGNVSNTSKSSRSRLASYNPLNYMFSEISQKKAEDQTHVLPLEREPSTIPKGTSDGNWEYPSPQQMYNALLRKGYNDTDVTAVESMVSIHNFLNEGAWSEIAEHERRFCKGLARGWRMSRRGEANALLMRDEADEDLPQPSLIRFQGRPKDMTPKATMLQIMGWLYPAGFGTAPPFDRHDWFVAREVDGKRKEIRYIIDYYEGPDEPTGDPVFFIDVRPAMSPTAAVERMMRWGGDVWYRASGGVVREQKTLISNLSQ